MGHISKKVIIGALLSGVIFTTGCSTMKHGEPVPKHIAKDMPAKEIQEIMAKAMETSARSLQVLSEVNNAEKAGELSYEEIRQANWRATYTPEGMAREVSITWNGPSQPIISKLASMTNYEVIFLNKPSPIAHAVHIDVEKEPVIDVLRKIDAQVSKIMTINIFEDKDAKRIEVTYAN